MPSANRRLPVRVVMLGPGRHVRGGITSIEQVILENCPPGLEIRHVATFAGESRFIRSVTYLASWAPFLRGGTSRRTDLVHVHFSQRGSTFRKVAMCAACVMMRKPFVLHAHGSRYQQFFPGLPRNLQRYIRSVFRRCAAFIALSEDWREFYAREFGLRNEQVFVLHNPVQVPAEAPVRRGGTSVRFVSFGRIGQRKGQFDVIRAVAAMPADVRRCCRVLFAGDGEADEARRLAEELGVAAHVEVHGWLDADQRDRLLAQADAFVLPSYNEGLPMALLEAMAWGLPPVTTPVGGIPEVVESGDNGLLVTPGDIAALSGAMRQLIEDEPLRLSMGRRARQRVEPLRVEYYMEHLRAIYEKAIGASAPAGGVMVRT